MNRSHVTYEELVSIENLLLAWQEFLPGKRNRKDVQEFGLNLMDNILSLHQDLVNGSYRHGSYQKFFINDPKPRVIHKATVRDRVLHHAAYRMLYPFFDRTFIADSFSCRLGKGTHKAMARFKAFYHTVSLNGMRQCWVLKCDIKKFFHSIDQLVLIRILGQYVKDTRIMALLVEIIGSFNSSSPAMAGLPLGNLTSQLFCNIYMNEFDQFVKHGLKARYYIRYADDFVIFSENKQELENLLPLLQSFLEARLSLALHPGKIFIKTFASGLDFLGWVHFKDHRVLRTATKKRVYRRFNDKNRSSYLGLLAQGNTQKIQKLFSTS